MSVNGLYDIGASGEDTLWSQYGWPDRATWKAAGRPHSQYGGGTITLDPREVPPSPTTPAGGTTTTGSTGKSSSGGFDLAGIFSGIPSTYLLIGGAVVLFMLLKKR